MRYLFVVLFVSSFAAARLQAADPGTAEARMRESLRATMLQLRNAENEKAALQAAQAEKDQQIQELTERADALTKQAIADREDFDKRLAALNAKVTAQENIIQEYKESLEKWKVSHGKITEIAQAKEAERARLASEGVLLKRTLEERERQNIVLYETGLEILKRYERFGLGTAIAAREPFTGIARVKLQTQVQGYQDQLDDQRARPASPAAAKAEEGQHDAKPAAKGRKQNGSNRRITR